MSVRCLKILAIVIVAGSMRKNCVFSHRAGCRNKSVVLAALFPRATSLYFPFFTVADSKFDKSVSL